MLDLLQNRDTGENYDKSLNGVFETNKETNQKEIGNTDYINDFHVFVQKR
jgi:hypothetical protein